MAGKSPSSRTRRAIRSKVRGDGMTGVLVAPLPTSHSRPLLCPASQEAIGTATAPAPQGDPPSRFGNVPRTGKESPQVSPSKGSWARQGLLQNKPNIPSDPHWRSITAPQVLSHELQITMESPIWNSEFQGNTLTMARRRRTCSRAENI